MSKRYMMESKEKPWVRKLQGDTRQELAEAVSRLAGCMPGAATIIDTTTGKPCGSFQASGWPLHPTESELRSGGQRSILRYYDNIDGHEWLWIADRSEAICVRP